MSGISLEATRLIDRLGRVPFSAPRTDKPAVERAIRAVLDRVDHSSRPFVWVKDAQTAYERIARWLRDIAAKDSHIAAQQAAWLAANKTASKAVWVTSQTVTPSPYLASRNLAWRTAQTMPWHTVRQAACLAAEAAFLGAGRDSIRRLATLAVRHSAGTCAWVIEQVDCLAALGRRPSEEPGFPLLEGLEAGLFLSCIMPHEIVCVPHPTLSVSNDRLHRADGPAVAWPSGEAYHFWRGLQVPGWIFEAPERLTLPAIRAERNQEIRRCMIEIYGLPRFLRESDAEPLHSDRFGTLWAVQVGGETWRFVEVVNGTPEPDGSRRVYVLDVTDAARVLRWPIATARAAVAATYGLRPEEYHPEVRT